LNPQPWSPEGAVKGAVLEASVVVLFPWVAYMMAGLRWQC